MIQLTNLSVDIGDFSLSNVSLAIPTGQYGVLMGKTGCGKTTLLEAVCGLKPVSSGHIHLMGRDVTHLSPAERGLGFMPQDIALFTHLSVRDHLRFGPRIHGWTAAEISDIVADLSESLGITHLLDRQPFGLSGGERQRVALGRALSIRPKVLCLDEPLSALDADTHEEISTLIKSLTEKHTITTLHITHSRAEALRVADIILKMEDGVVTPEALY
jgi:molybdate/tungstate transport system ATP-binding protein